MKYRKILDKAATGIAKASGGSDLVDYLGTKIAQKRNSNLSIPQTTSGKDALKSGAKVAGTILTAGAGGGISRALAKKTAKKIIKVRIGGRGGEIPQRATWDEGGW